MSKQAIWKYIYILTFSVLVMLCGAGHACAQAPAAPVADTAAIADTSGEKPANSKIQAGGHQLCLGADILHPITNTTARSSYELEAHYYLKNEFYGVAEGGWGTSKVDYTDLKYNTTNGFGRLGFNKSILARESPQDWDMMFVGMRIGYAQVNRSAANYTVVDSVWGNSPGASPGKSFGAVWAELTGGMRVELLKGLMAGWNIRGKFLMNGKSFKDLAPLNIAGYGRGDKNTNFDFNVYVSYAIRWKKAVPAAPVKATKIPASPSLEK